MAFTIITVTCPWPDCRAPVTAGADDLAAAARTGSPVRCETCGRECGVEARFEFHAYVPRMRLTGDDGPDLDLGDGTIVLGGGE